MNNLNSVLIEGILLQDPEEKVLVSGTVYLFTIESKGYYQSVTETEEESSNFNIEVWGVLAKACLQNLKKGRGVRVVGRLKEYRWEDAFGKAQSQVKIIAEHVEFKPLKKGD